MAPIFTGLKFGFSRSDVAAARSSNILEEYIFFGGTTGTLSVPAQTTRIQVAGVAGGGGGAEQTSGGGGNGWSGGGGGGSNVRGDFFPLGGATTIYYSVGNGGSPNSSGGDTFIKQTNSGGTDIFRVGGGGNGSFNVGSPTSGGSGGSAPVPTSGPNGVVGGPGGTGIRTVDNTQLNAPSGNTWGTAGGGGGGAHDNNGLPGFAGGSGGTSTVPSTGLLSSNGVGPAPSTWSFGSGTTPGGSPGGPGPYGGGPAPAGGDVINAYGGGGGAPAPPPQGGGGGGGGAGAGIKWTDPADPTNDNKYFGGGGGANGYSNPLSYNHPSPLRGSGGKGVLVIRFRND